MRIVDGVLSTRRWRSREMRPAIVARVRLFVLLISLSPFFGVLQGFVEEGVPRIEFRIVPRGVPTEVVVERIVERLVFVPVPTATLRPWTRSLWDLARWDLSRLPRASSVSASIALFRPVLITPPETNAALAAGIVGPDARSRAWREYRPYNAVYAGSVDASLCTHHAHLRADAGYPGASADHARADEGGRGSR